MRRLLAALRVSWWITVGLSGLMLSTLLVAGLLTFLGLLVLAGLARVLPRLLDWLLLLAYGVLAELTS